MTDPDPGILGNLPRSRPGTRSDKRSGGQKPVTPAVASKNPSGAQKSRPKAAAKAAAQPARPAPAPRTPAPEPARPQAGPQGIDPVGDVIRAGEAIARSGLRVGSAIAGEALRRLSGR